MYITETNKQLCEIYTANSEILEQRTKKMYAKLYKKELKNLINLINDSNYLKNNELMEYTRVGGYIPLEEISNYSIEKLINRYFKNITTARENYEINIEYIQQYKKEYIKYIEKLTKQLDNLEKEN